MMLQVVSSEESESDLRLPRNDSGSDLPRELDQSMEIILRSHMRRPLGKSGEGLSSVSVPPSQLAVRCAFPMSDTHSEARIQGLLKGWKPRVNTCHGTPSLELYIREMLEARTRRLWAKHRRCVLLKVLKALTVSQLEKAQPFPILQLTLPPPPKASVCPASP